MDVTSCIRFLVDHKARGFMLRSVDAKRSRHLLNVTTPLLLMQIRAISCSGVRLPCLSKPFDDKTYNLVAMHFRSPNKWDMKHRHFKPTSQSPKQGCWLITAAILEDTAKYGSIEVAKSSVRLGRPSNYYLVPGSPDGKRIARRRARLAG